MKKLLTILALWNICGISGLASAQEKVQDPHPDILRVMTYNTWYGFKERDAHVKKDAPSAQEWVKAQTPDVVALQELTGWTPERLKKLAAGWGHEHTSLLKNSGFSVGLSSRWPIETVEKGIKGMHHGYLHAKTNGVHYFLVHLSPFKWEVRQREAKILVDKMKLLIEQGEKVIILGDFNTVSKEDAKWLEAKEQGDYIKNKLAVDKKHGHVQNLKDGKLDYEAMNIFFKGGLKDTATGHLPETFEARLTSPTGIWSKTDRVAVKMGERIDFILSTENLFKTVTSCKIITKGDVNKISDHYPVITDFSTNRKTKKMTKPTKKGTIHSDFNNLDGWSDDSTADSPKSYKIVNGTLYMSTRANSKDRVKIATTKRLGLGEYKWRVFCPSFGKGDQASIGAFLYKDDKNEIDFEIGYGTEKLRKKLNAKSDDLVCYLTTQGNPYHSSQILLKRDKAYTLSIKLTKNETNHLNIQWAVDGKTVKTFRSKISADHTFTAHCSLENLVFMGDHIPKKKSWTKFDYFTFTP